jgi:hypothetical protein
MRVASILLVLVLMSTSAISGTFAKYVSKAEAGATARVAKWGVEFVTHSDDLFKPQYNYKTVPTGVSADYSVEANTDVVAPGTSGTGYNFTTKHPMGDPEVSYVVTFDVKDGAKTIFLDESGTKYYPIKYSLKLGSNVIATNVQDFDAVMGALEKCQYMYDVDNKQYYISVDGGVNWLPHTGIPVLDLTWDWTFYVDDPTDVKDTKLGNLAAGYSLVQVGATDVELEVAFSITATATQVD